MWQIFNPFNTVAEKQGVLKLQKSVEFKQSRLSNRIFAWEQ